jgi:predicted nucleic acid-binding protein
MYVLDTNVLSELRRGKPAQSVEVCAWAASVQASQQFLSSISIMELEMGILSLERKSPPQGSALRAWFDGVRQAFAGRVLAFSEGAAMRCARLHVPDPRSARDSMIAATALEYGFAVVTRNVRDFEGTGAKLINPWGSI